MTTGPGDGRSLTEPARDIPVRAEVDVLVAGGGLGGVAAAMAAARAGAKTLLIERNSFLGGTATAGMCCSIFNCYFTSEGVLATDGIAVEVADELATATGYGRAWRRHRGHIIYDIELGKLTLSNLVRDANSEILSGVVVAGAVMEGGRLDAVIVESKSGREAIRAKVFVDATGDADLLVYSGGSYHTAAAGKHSLCFRLGNVDIDRFVDFFRENPTQYPEYMDVEWTLAEALAQYDECGTFLFPHGGGIQMLAFQAAKKSGALPASIGLHDTTDACQMHGIRSTGTLHVVTGFVQFDGVDAEMISRSVEDGRKMAFAVASVYKRYLPGFVESYVVGTAPNLGVRTSRYLDADFVLTRDMMMADVSQPDAIGRAVAWDSEKRHPGPGAWNVQALRSGPFDIPYRCMLPRRVDGLIMGAGRSVSAEHPSLLRVMAHTMVVGQGAGVAAAVAAGTGRAPRHLDYRDLKHELSRQGVK